MFSYFIKLKSLGDIREVPGKSFFIMEYKLNSSVIYVSKLTCKIKSIFLTFKVLKSKIHDERDGCFHISFPYVKIA